MTLPAPLSQRLIRPTIDTRFYIDYDWWERQSREFNVYLQSHLCPEHREAFGGQEETVMVDWVDPITAAVEHVDLLQHTLRKHCSQQPGYLTHHTSLVDAVFRVSLANGNQPLMPDELAERIGRPGQGRTILRTLSGRRVYKGLRPCPA